MQGEGETALSSIDPCGPEPPHASLLTDAGEGTAASTGSEHRSVLGAPASAEAPCADDGAPPRRLCLVIRKPLVFLTLAIISTALLIMFSVWFVVCMPRSAAYASVASSDWDVVERPHLTTLAGYAIV